MLCACAYVCVCIRVYLKSPRLRRGWTQKRWACKPPPKTPGLQLLCSSADRQSDGVSQGGLLSPLSLSVEWLTRAVSLSSPLSLSLSLPTPFPRHGHWRACEGGQHADVGKVAREGPSNEVLGYPWEEGWSSQESCLYVCFLN